MARYALLVGISKYDKLTDLPKAATDAEAIARVLEQHGDFYKIDRLPKHWVAEHNRYEVASDKRVTADELFNAIKTFLQEAEHNEVLIYFAGHGFRVASRAGKQRGFLAASDSTADGRNAIALDDDFNALLAQSNLSSLILLLDCCHAGALLEAELTRQVIEPSLATFNTPRDFYLITACRAAERSREGETHGIFTAAVLEGLSFNNANQETGRVSVNRLFDFVYHSLQGSGQEPFQLGGGRSITLVTYLPQGTTVPEIDESIVPYRGLEPFEKEQAEFFFGRKQVVEDIWKALDRGNFVAVIGASGSGKSSAVQAGLIPWLEAGGWHVLKPMKPGVSPLAKLAATFESLFQENRSQKQLDEFIHSHPEGLRQIAEQLPGSAKFLLVVDQFEEVFTLSRIEERQRFIELLTQVVEAPYPQLAVVTTMRADFLEPCLHYPTLTQLIQAQAIFMPPLIGADLEQAIAEPAKCLGYSFEPGLLGEILHDVGQEAGCLPLLQFALLELWERRDRQNRQLTRSAYQEMGSALGSLDCYAEQIYTQFSALEQDWVRRLCLKLVRTGIDLKDTRQRQPKYRLLELAVDEATQETIKTVLQELVDKRLLVTGEEAGESWVDLAHESLMETWQRFAKWRLSERELRRLHDHIEDALREWSKDSAAQNLLMGRLLEQVQQSWQSLELQLSSSAKEFCSQSILHKELQQRTLNESFIAEQAAKATSLLDRSPIERLLNAIEVANLSLERLQGNITESAQTALSEAIDGSREQNVLLGHPSAVNAVAFDSESKFIFSGGYDGSVRIWDKQGNEAFKPLRVDDSIKSMALSNDGQYLAVGTVNGFISVWKIDENQLAKPFKDIKVHFLNCISPDSQYIATGSMDGTIRLWDKTGHLSLLRVNSCGGGLPLLPSVPMVNMLLAAIMMKNSCGHCKES
jgi:type II secretory pathway predicted ATPase ExeA